MSKKIQDLAALFFIIVVIILTGLSILGIWDFVSPDVVSKSVMTMGLLALAAVVVIMAARAVDAKSAATLEQIPEEPNPLFPALRHVTVAFLIAAVSLLALVGIMAIWEIIEGEAVQKSISSIALAAFSAFVVVVTCKSREGGNGIDLNQKISGKVWLLIILSFFLLQSLGGLLW